MNETKAERRHSKRVQRQRKGFDASWILVFMFIAYVVYMGLKAKGVI